MEHGCSLGGAPVEPTCCCESVFVDGLCFGPPFLGPFESVVCVPRIAGILKPWPLETRPRSVMAFR